MFLRLTSSTLALLALSAPAAFSLTAEEVWTTWVDYYKASGYEVTEGGREAVGNALTLTDVVFSVTDEAAGSVVSLTAPRIEMSETGGGDIRTIMPQPVTVSFQGESENYYGDPEIIDLKGTLTTNGLEVISSDSSGHHVDKYSAPEMVLSIDSFTVDDEALGSNPITFTMTRVEGETSFLGGLNTNSTASIDALGYTLEFTNPESDSEKVTGSGTFEALKVTSESSAPDGVQIATGTQLSQALRAGLALQATLSMGPSQHQFNFAGTSYQGPQTGEMTLSIGDMSADLSMRDGVLGYRGDTTALQFNLTGNQIPMPIAFGIGESSFDIQFPLLQSDQPQPFKFAYSLGQVTMDEGIWSLFDPTRALPRDPADLDVDITGTLRILTDLPNLADMSQAEVDRMTDAPLEPVDLTVNQIALKAAGVTINADGKLTVPEGGSIDTPVGNLHARYSGVNGLLDNLVRMGLMSQDDVGGVRMMMMMFARPVDGQTDTLQTELEFREDGSIFANGQQIQ